MKNVFFALVALCFCVAAHAQQKVDLLFDNTEFDFGTVREEGGGVSHVFRFVNTGSAPFTVQEVTASCGCTTPEWTRSAVFPQDSGFVKVTFDPNDRPGAFHKSVRVVVAGESGTITEILDIFGRVAPRAETIENQYPYHFGTVYFRAAVLAFDTLNKNRGETAERKLELVNVSAEPVRFALILPPYIESDAPDAIEPNSRLSVTFRYRSDKNTAWGFVADEIGVSVNGVCEGNIRAQAVLKEDFGHLSRADRIAAPIASLQTGTVDFGRLTIGRKYSKTILLSNFGQNPLAVRAIVSSGGYLTGTAKKTLVKSGKSVKIDIEVDATNLHPFTFVKNLQLITNDPTNPVQTIVVTWETVE